MRLPAVPSRTLRAAIAASVLFSSLTALSASSATAEEAHLIGDRYVDGLDSRHAAASVAQMARGAGYAATAATDGRTANDAWTEAQRSSLFGFFGHANAGALQVRDRSGSDSDQYLGAGSDTDLLPLYSNYRFFTEFLPYADVDDMRLAIFAGCYTANSHPSLGDLEDVAKSRGVDATVAFPGLVYFPARCVDCVYSGNYFWDRFSDHYRSGASLSVSLSRARTDLVNKEGKAGGWGAYRITGSVTSPGSVKLRPQGSGEPLTSQPFGINPYTIGSLAVTGSRSLPNGEVEQTTREGVLIRRDRAGDVLDIWGPSSTSGDRLMDMDTLRATAKSFATEVTGEHGHTLSSEDEVFHLDGEQLASFTWTLGGPVPQIINVEVDRRTGAVTYLGRATAPHATTGTHVLTAAEAEQIALDEAAHGAQLINVEKVTWGQAAWLVHTRSDRDGSALGAQIQETTIDAVTGEVIRIASN